MKKFFVGIDFSKQTFDVALVRRSSPKPVDYGVFDNNEQGYLNLVAWLDQKTLSPSSDWLLCGEHTGLCSFGLAAFASKAGISLWLESALQIKQSKGMSREKSDPVDAAAIALYALRFEDRSTVYQPSGSIIDGLKDLLAYRERLIKVKVSLKQPAQELRRVKQESSAAAFVHADSLLLIRELNGKLKAVEQQMEALIAKDSALSENYQRVTSVKGVGPINALMILAITANFSLFTDARKFGCYCGVVPFEHKSGTSVRGKTRVSHLANKQMKALLTQAARTAVMHDPLLKCYYKRKAEEGKHDKVIINNVRNKLIHRVFAVVRDRQAYDPYYAHPLQKVA